MHIGRQAVFDRTGLVVGYELLFRDSDVTYARVGGLGPSGVAATAQVLLAAFLDVGLRELVGDKFALVNLPRPFLTGALPLPTDTDQLVLEVLEDVGHDLELLDGVRRLHAQGYRLALDDFVLTPQSAPLLAEVDLVKIDVLQHGNGVESLVRTCHAAGRQVIVEKVETEAQLRTCRRLGVAYYQGYLLERPQVLQGRSLSPSQTTCLQLLRALDADDVTLDAIAVLVRADPGLSYRLLRAANSVSSGRVREVSSLREALTVLGLTELRRWTLLLLVADLPPEAGAGVDAALVRAGMCEQLAVGTGEQDEAFVVGLASSLGSLMGLSDAALLDALPLSRSSRSAVLEHLGSLGKVLSAVLSYEQGVPCVPAGSTLPECAPRKAFLAAVRSADQRHLALVS